MTEKADSLDSAYAIRTPEDSVRHYGAWAVTYETDFAERMDWVMPRLVVGLYRSLGGAGPVLDAGAGTGLLGVELAKDGVGPVDGIDISTEMLAVARGKGVYRNLSAADLTRPLAIGDGIYGGCVSSGTFTHGHVGTEAFDELLRVMRPGAVFAGSIHPGVYEAKGFAAAFAAFGSRIGDLALHPVFGFGPKAQGDHARDPGLIVCFTRT
ncbi:MAG: class I SAM-dependent DNA methyltransferase [Paracoccaceae bacterium]